MRRTPLLLILPLLVAACGPSAPPPEPAADPQAVDAPTDLQAARRTWAANGPASYAYTLEISCFCLHRGRYAVEVRDGEIVSVRDAQTGEPSPPSRAEWIVTVDRLLEVMGQAASAGTPTRATYDPRFGYPTEAEIGLLADDSGTLYTISDLRAL